MDFWAKGFVAHICMWAQVEIKLRLPSKEAHDRVAHELRSSFRETHQQENYFFDGKNGELEKQRMVLRCRFYNHDKRAIVTLKVRMPLSCLALL